jgi:hypothetical protein
VLLSMRLFCDNEKELFPFTRNSEPQWCRHTKPLRITRNAEGFSEGADPYQ